jgi:protease-4
LATGIKEGPSLAMRSGHFNETVIRSGGSERVAHIDLEGIITASPERMGTSMVDDFRELVEAALNDHKVKAIVIRINSPGGEVTASDRLHRIIQEADKKKPVIAYLDTIAASGGYYAACGTRRMIAHPTTFTGSIGVIMQSMKYRELFEKVGVSMETYKSGALKDLLSGTRETSPEEKTLVNNLVQETYTRFLGVVSASRGKPVEELRASPLTDGRIFSGSQALAAGMVDQNGFIEDAYDEAMKLAGVSGATVIRYTPRVGIFDALAQFSRASDARNHVEIDVSERLLPRLQAGVPLYLHADGYGGR